MKELKKYLVLIVLFVAVVVLSNQDNNITAEAETSSETQAITEEQPKERSKIILVVNEDDCKKFMVESQTQEQVVSADYVAGVDVYGRDVVSAETNIKETLFSGQDIISISFDPLALQELETNGLDAEKINVGQLSLKNGNFVFADKILDEKTRDMVIKACKDIIK